MLLLARRGLSGEAATISRAGGMNMEMGAFQPPTLLAVWSAPTGREAAPDRLPARIGVLAKG